MLRFWLSLTSELSPFSCIRLCDLLLIICYLALIVL